MNSLAPEHPPTQPIRSASDNPARGLLHRLVRALRITGLTTPIAAGRAHFSPLGEAAIEPLLRASWEQPAVIFKHDPHCGISWTAYRKLDTVPIEVMLVDVATQRKVARAIAQRTRVTHESPQVLVVRDGEVTWSASHFAVTGEAVSDALRDAAHDLPVRTQSHVMPVPPTCQTPEQDATGEAHQPPDDASSRSS